jgi:glycosyltransferase involved in cell wall biosynthesis
VRKINILADESNADPTNGWVLPYHSLMLNQQLSGTAKIMRGEYFISENVKRSEGEWSVWKSMLQRKFVDWLPEYSTLFHNSRKIFSEINETPCTSQTVPIITVLMSVYNEKHFLNDCLSSLAYQTTGHFQTVIIDDASTDGSYELLKKWECRIPGCTILRQATNQGKGKSMNLGLQHVTTPYVLEMDGDDWLDPDAIEVLERRISTLKPNTVYVYGDRRKFRTDDYGEYHEFTGIYRGRKWSGAKVFALDKKPYGPRIYRTAVLNENGGWPTASGMGNSGRLFEDFLLALQLLKRGGFVYWNGTPVYNIRIHRNSESVSHLHERDKWLNPYINQLIKSDKNRSIRKE